MVTGKRLHEKVKPFATRLRGVAHPHRLAILYLLAHEPLEVRDIVDYLGLAENLVSHHLKQMHTTGWLLREKAGRIVTYRLNEKAFFEIRKLLSDTPFDRHVLSPKSR